MLEGIHKQKNGNTFPVEANISYAVLNEREYMVAVVRDITERKAAEQELKRSKERLFKAQKMAHVGNWEWDVVENKLYWSEEVYRIYGLDPDHFIPTFEAVGKAMHPDDLELFIKAVDEALHQKNPLSCDYRLIRPDGTIRTVHTIGEVFCDPAGKPLMMLGTVQDITEHKQTEERLRLTQFSIDRAPLFISWISPEGLVLEVNETTEKQPRFKQSPNNRTADVEARYNVHPRKMGELWADIKSKGSVRSESSLTHC